MHLSRFSSKKRKYRFFKMYDVSDDSLWYIHITEMKIVIPVIREKNTLRLPWTLVEGNKIWHYAWFYHFAFTPLFARQSVCFFTTELKPCIISKRIFKINLLVKILSLESMNALQWIWKKLR